MALFYHEDMKKFLWLFFLSCSILQAQDRVVPCQCKTSLDWRYEGYIDVFDSEEASSIISKTRNNMQDEDFLLVEITGSTDSLFRVNIRYALFDMPLPLDNVFIRKQHLIILSRLLNKPMPLYSEPFKTSTVILNVEHSYGYVYNVIDCQDDWLKVSFTDDNGISHEGWMSNEYQCPDVYSACMGS